MSDRTRYLLVCSITSGRNFPERKNSRLVIEGKFNDEILESDPVQQTTAPQVNTGKVQFITRLISFVNFRGNTPSYKTSYHLLRIGMGIRQKVSTST